MIRKLAYLLLACALLSGIGEACGLLLPTLSWPFTAAREMEFLHTAGFSDSWITPDGKFLWFGWLCTAAALALSIWLLRQPPGRFRLTPINARRIARFKSIRRGYAAFLVFLGLVFVACLDQALVGKRALLVIYEGRWYAPAFTRSVIPGETFGLTGDAAKAEPDYRRLKTEEGHPGKPSLVLLPLIPYDPSGDAAAEPVVTLERRSDGLCYAPGEQRPYNGQASRLYEEGTGRQHMRLRFRQGLPDGPAQGWLPDGTQVLSTHYARGMQDKAKYTGPGTLGDFLTRTPEHSFHIIHHHPSPPLAGGHLLGTNSQGSDILAYLYGGLQVNLKAAFFYLPCVYLIGISMGMLMGYFGGKYDLAMQRLIEILSQVPFLFVVMIISDLVPLRFKGLFLILALLSMFGWMQMTYLLRTSTMKEKARDYVSAARVMGASTPRILFVHILPNLIAILVTLIPFSVSGLILALASLDYLGFGLPDTYASWGRLLNDGLANLSKPWIVSSAFSALVFVLLLVTFMGEAVREAFDPKKFTTYK